MTTKNITLKYTDPQTGVEKMELHVPIPGPVPTYRQIGRATIVTLPGFKYEVGMPVNIGSSGFIVGRIIAVADDKITVDFYAHDDDNHDLF